MTTSRITQTDLLWWYEFAATRTWTYAKTYATTAPHDYVVEYRTPGVTHEDIERAARVICTFGTPGKYYSVTKIYLVSPDGRYRWWTEDRHFTDATLVNRGTTTLAYGIQNAPSTASGITTSYDEVATSWDATSSTGADEAECIRRMLSSVRTAYPPHVLDIGCGTGRLLDLGLVAPERYAALDSSRAMLNTLIRKHPKVAAVYPMDVREALARRLFTAGQFDWVALDAAVELSPEQHSQVREMARRAHIVVDNHSWVVNDTHQHLAAS